MRQIRYFLLFSSSLLIRFESNARVHFFQDLVPLIISAAILHSKSTERDRLLKTLFNLYKKPSYNQRQVLLHACLCFAKQSGPLRVHAELLPQCWENLNNKLDERRSLVAEACGILTPHLPVPFLLSKDNDHSRLSF
jgi:hypothetical protein